MCQHSRRMKCLNSYRGQQNFIGVVLNNLSPQGFYFICSLEQQHLGLFIFFQRECHGCVLAQRSSLRLWKCQYCKLGVFTSIWCAVWKVNSLLPGDPSYLYLSWHSAPQAKVFCNCLLAENVVLLTDPYHGSVWVLPSQETISNLFL